MCVQAHSRQLSMIVKFELDFVCLWQMATTEIHVDVGPELPEITLMLTEATQNRLIPVIIKCFEKGIHITCMWIRTQVIPTLGFS